MAILADDFIIHIKMSSKIYIAFVILIALSAACNNSIKADPEFNYDKIGKQADTANSKSPITLPENTTQTTTLPTPVVSTTNVASTGLNPEHGKPGHRCDIAVGAPLNSKPVTVPAQQTQPVTTARQTKVVQTKNTATATGMNPEHGKPGHRCDIPIGAPLNSKPVTTAANQNQPIDLTAKKTVTPPGMNPPHGEPGHRCDIAVGSPLNQPVKTATDQAVKTVSPLIKDSAKN
ncbi:MAG TPA: hypothetical protein VMY77_03235 [Chitinophagaceae bacterium]|nr:hypothetical protein [Chitinophagaceae bacterium]